MFKVEVTLHPDDKGILPFGSRREVVHRYDQLESWGAEGMRMIQRLREYEYLVFDDLEIGFTGQFELSYPCFDYWEVPWPIEEEDEKVQVQAIARFVNGRLIDWSEHIADGAIE